MHIIKNIKVPTGNILIVGGDYGKLECLSIGDYGKEKNIKADFLGLPNEINGVPNGPIIPLEEKWVITISSQYGCSMGCKFCDVPNVGPGRNATFDDMVGQVLTAVSLHPEIKHTKRLNVHYARMGEPTFNRDVLSSAIYLAGYFKSKGWTFHPVISTMMPRRNTELFEFLHQWCVIKNNILGGEAGLQLSINTTDIEQRASAFSYSSMQLPEIGRAVANLPQPKGRKYTLNFALTESPIDPVKLLNNFEPSDWICKITPMHKTKACDKNNLTTKDGYDNYYPYKETEQKLKTAGYDVIVFIPSKEEDESRITCGNAILSHKEAQ